MVRLRCRLSECRGRGRGNGALMGWLCKIRFQVVISGLAWDEMEVNRVGFVYVMPRCASVVWSSVVWFSVVWCGVI